MTINYDIENTPASARAAERQLDQHDDDKPTRSDLAAEERWGR